MNKTSAFSNMIKDGGGHYYIEYAAVDEDDYKYSIDMNSDASQLSNLAVIERLYLDKVGDTKVREINLAVVYGGVQMYLIAE